ncbi:hypothetical protein LZ31DRAFT_238367 [Colletotrichum somersetense]|nr:hypothetical protein LZ31DRAFT_238367 [Colletotrichum somersetense]
MPDKEEKRWYVCVTVIRKCRNTPVASHACPFPRRINKLELPSNPIVVTEQGLVPVHRQFVLQARCLWGRQTCIARSLLCISRDGRISVERKPPASGFWSSEVTGVLLFHPSDLGGLRRGACRGVRNSRLERVCCFFLTYSSHGLHTCLTFPTDPRSPFHHVRTDREQSADVLAAYA